jgi:hypothetical protein
MRRPLAIVCRSAGKEGIGDKDGGDPEDDRDAGRAHGAAVDLRARARSTLPACPALYICTSPFRGQRGTSCGDAWAS